MIEKNCLTCKYLISCSLDKQAFYKFVDKQCDEWEMDDFHKWYHKVVNEEISKATRQEAEAKLKGEQE